MRPRQKVSYRQFHPGGCPHADDGRFTARSGLPFSPGTRRDVAVRRSTHRAIGSGSDAGLSRRPGRRTTRPQQGQRPRISPDHFDHPTPQSPAERFPTNRSGDARRLEWSGTPTMTAVVPVPCRCVAIRGPIPIRTVAQVDPLLMVTAVSAGPAGMSRVAKYPISGDCRDREAWQSRRPGKASPRSPFIG